MLREPQDWDKNLSAVLFTYREVPQESFGFSPLNLYTVGLFEAPFLSKRVVYKEIKDPNVKTTHQHTLYLKDRLETMVQLAKENLEKSATRYKKHYDGKARNRSFKVGGKALVLLPTDNNKLLFQWKGPFAVTQKVNRVDYHENLPHQLA